MLTLPALALLVLTQQPTCTSDYGQTACGYQCTSNYGQVRCAQTPMGVCTSNYGKVVCWDPPPFVTEPPGCKADSGTIACGYHCTANYGQVRCAQTPQGVCTSNFGQVVCWDPPPFVTEPAGCLANFGKIACGYQCVANFGEVRCAQTPQGVCTAANGHVTCFDPRPRPVYRR